MTPTLVSGGRRSGKTTALLEASIMKAMYENANVAFIVQNTHLKNLVRQQIIDRVRNTGQLVGYTNSSITFRNGASIRLYDFHGVAHLRYLEIDYLYVDEPNEDMMRRLQNLAPVLQDTKIMMSEVDGE